jgi:hypothetical protein
MKRRPEAEKLLAAELEDARRNTDAAGGSIRLMKLQVAAADSTTSCRAYEKSATLERMFPDLFVAKEQNVG